MDAGEAIGSLGGRRRSPFPAVTALELLAADRAASAPEGEGVGPFFEHLDVGDATDRPRTIRDLVVGDHAGHLDHAAPRVPHQVFLVLGQVARDGLVVEQVVEDESKTRARLQRLNAPSDRPEDGLRSNRRRTALVTADERHLLVGRLEDHLVVLVDGSLTDAVNEAEHRAVESPPGARSPAERRR
jgi:hypothetical protein